MTRAITTVWAVGLAIAASGTAARGQSPALPASRPSPKPIAPILTPEAQVAADRDLIDRFVSHLRTRNDVAESARKAVADAWAAHRADEQPRDFLPAAIAMICEPFKNGLQAFENEDHAAAEQALRPLMADKDPYISLHATAVVARSLVEQDRLDEASQRLNDLIGRRADLAGKTFLEPEVDFLLAYCQLANLEYDKATETLEQFERRHPNAPDKYRLPARQMLAELHARRPESLGEVSDLMVYAGRRLGRGLADKPVRDSQKRAIELLDQLIEEAEHREKQQQSSAQASGKGGGGGQRMGNTPLTPARQSMLPTGQGRKGELDSRPAARPGEMWGRMRPEERQRILQSIRESFPSRYRQLVEQYYRQLAKEQ